MKLYCLKAEQAFPISEEDAWSFFSDPHNLAEITPPSLAFRIVSEAPKEIYAGLIIRYRLKPLLGISTDWITEITHVRAPSFFVDEQRIGPYRIWHHEHFIEKTTTGVLVRDVVHYALPLGPVGRAVHAAVVARRLTKIFDYRRNVLKVRLGDESMTLNVPSEAGAVR